MSLTCPVKQLFHGQPVLEGAGVRLKRVFGFGETALFDPFLLFDDFRSANPAHYLKGFPWHPHRGIETITYMLAGTAEHGDSMGNQGVIGPGDVQWMTAGSGIIHQEMPKGEPDGRMEGFQLWANLPAAQKMMEPRYRDVNASQIPVVKLENGVNIRIICGQVGETQGPVSEIVIDPEYLDITVPAGSSYQHPVKPDYTAMAYVIEGSGRFEPGEAAEWLENGTLAVFGAGEEIAVRTEDSEVRFLFISGRPLREPIAWAGPIVMNTQSELDLAFREYREGTFVKHKL